MECPKCGSKNIRVGVSVFMYVSPKEAHRLTKKAIQKKTTELWGADWDKARIVCRDCLHVHMGC